MTSKRMSPSKAVRQLEEHADHLAERARTSESTGMPANWDKGNAAACRLGAEALRSQKGEMEERQRLFEEIERALSTLERVELEATMRADLRREVQVAVSLARKAVADLGDPDVEQVAAR